MAPSHPPTHPPTHHAGLAQHMLARRQRRTVQRGVHVGPGADHDGINIGVIDDLAPDVGGRHAAGLGGSSGGAQGAVAHRAQLHPGDLQQVWDVAQLGVAPRADDAHPACRAGRWRPEGVEPAAGWWAAAAVAGGDGGSGSQGCCSRPHLIVSSSPMLSTPASVLASRTPARAESNLCETASVRCQCAANARCMPPTKSARGSECNCKVANLGFGSLPDCRRLVNAQSATVHCAYILFPCAHVFNLGWSYRRKQLHKLRWGCCEGRMEECDDGDSAGAVRINKLGGTKRHQ